MNFLFFFRKPPRIINARGRENNVEKGVFDFRVLLLLGVTVRFFRVEGFVTGDFRVFFFPNKVFLISSVAFPHSNCRAEVAVKTVKRLLIDNIGSNGTLDTEKFQRAMLHYRNTPDRDTGLSPAMSVFGRVIRDFIPVHPGRYLPHPAWRETLVAREEALKNRHQKICERLTEHTRQLPPLKVGDTVRLQNQSGPNPTKWDRSGVVVEVRQFDQYVVRVDGSGRVTLRNRKFLRKYIPVISREPVINIPGPPASVPVTTSLKPTVKPVTLPLLVKPVTPVTPVPAKVNHNTTSKSESSTPKRFTRVFHKSNPVEPSPIKLFTPQVIDQPPPVVSTAQPTPDTSEQLPQSTPSTEQQSTQPAEPQPKHIPLALKQLLPHNAPGLTEHNIVPDTTRRVTRQSTKK